jgi:beta-lactamase class A
MTNSDSNTSTNADPTGSRLSEEIEDIAASAGALRVAVAYHDYTSGLDFGHRADEWFHAASTIKIPVLVGVFAAIDEGRFTLDSRVHVRNRFISAAGGTAYRVERSRDAGADLHGRIGKTIRVSDLTREMIVTSSNLGTNLLVDLVGIDELRAAVSGLVPEGIELRRGVEDEAAFEAGINNRVTAAGLVRVLRLIEENALSAESCARMLEILHAQEFRSGIPAGLPEGARVANKTGEISTMAHDVGLVYVPDREPYALAILTEWDATATAGRRDTLAALSRTVYEHLSKEAG